MVATGGYPSRCKVRQVATEVCSSLPDAQFCLGQVYEEGKGVPESDEMAASWYRKAADHFSDVSGVLNAEVELAYMYRDGRLKRNNVEAYMWFAVVSSSVDPPTDDDMKPSWERYDQRGDC